MLQWLTVAVRPQLPAVSRCTVLIIYYVIIQNVRA